MSATSEAKPVETKLSAADRKAAYTSQHSPGIKTAAAGMHEAEESLAVWQRAVGRAVNVAVAAFVASGGTAEEVQKLVLSDIGGDYSWSYVSSWQRAAVVFDSLTEDNQKLYGDSTESLKQLGRFPEEKRNDKAAKLAKNGKGASVRVLRDAADKAKPKSNRKRNTTNGVDTLVGKLTKVRKAVKVPASVTWTPDLQKLVTDLAEVSARAAKNGRALSKTEISAVAQLSYFGPVTDDK